MRRLPRGALSLCLMALSALACADGTGLPAFGIVRVRAVFAPGEEPAALGVQVSDIRVVLRRDGGSGPVAVDTMVPYVDGDTLSWLLELAAPPEPIGITAELGASGTTLYSGSDQTSVPEGLDPSGVHEVLVRFVGSGVVSVDVTPDSVDLAALGATQQFTAVARDGNGTVVTGTAFTWTSANPAVATVDPTTGLATAVGVGRTIISATAGGATDTAVLRVLPGGGGGPIVSIEVTPPAGVITALGATLPFTAVARDGQGNPIPGVVFTWSSANGGVATVDPTGQATGLAVGATTIAASAGGRSGTASLVVTQVPASITVVPASAALGVADTLTFTAVARDANGHLIPGAHIAWSTADPVIATIHPTNGLATTVAPGTVTVRAQSGGATGSATLRVVDIAQVTVIPGGEPKVSVGGTVPFTAVVTDAAGNQVPGVRVIWSSSDASVASIDPVTGVATGLAAGSSAITAAAGNVSGQALLVVLAPGGGPPP